MARFSNAAEHGIDDTGDRAEAAGVGCANAGALGTDSFRCLVQLILSVHVEAFDGESLHVHCVPLLRNSRQISTDLDERDLISISL
jgi:hypothetical protein